MKGTRSFFAIIAIALGMAAPAWAGLNDPEVIIYRFPGLKDDGGADNVGVATVFNCTNFSGAFENIRFVGRNEVGGLLNNTLVQFFAHLASLAVTSHVVAAYSGFVPKLNTQAVSSGTVAIAATSTNIICTAMIIDAANPKPVGVALRGIRFSPVPGSEE